MGDTKTQHTKQRGGTGTQQNQIPPNMQCFLFSTRWCSFSPCVSTAVTLEKRETWATATNGKPKTCRNTPMMNSVSRHGKPPTENTKCNRKQQNTVNPCVVFGSNFTFLNLHSFFGIRNTGFFQPNCPKITWMHACTLYGTHATFFAGKMNDYYIEFWVFYSIS